jgi:hypothetical protein
MFNTNSASCKKTSDYILEKVYASGITEKSHSRFMKYILGVNVIPKYVYDFTHSIVWSLYNRLLFNNLPDLLK